MPPNLPCACPHGPAVRARTANGGPTLVDRPAAGWICSAMSAPLSVDFTPQPAVVGTALELPLTIADEPLGGGGVGVGHCGSPWSVRRARARRNRWGWVG